MKICHKCKAQQSGSRFSCIDCGAILSSSISKQEVERLEQQMQANLDKMYNKSDPLYVSLPDKITGFAAIAGFLVTLVFSVIYSGNLPAVGAGVLLIFMFFALCALDAFVPSILWSIEKLRLSFRYNFNDAEPSDFYKISRKLSIYGLFIAAVVLLIYTLPILINPPPVPEFNPLDAFEWEIETGFWSNIID